MSHFVGYHCLPSLSFTILFYLYNFYYHIIDHSGYFFHIFNLSLQICRDFHKSFCNLPKFFREHGRGARAIFHLCDGRRPLMEDDLWWNTTFDGRRPLMEDDLWWKTTFDGRQPLMEDNLWWKTTFDWRHSFMEDDLWWKTTMRTTIKTKRTCKFLEGTRCWTYVALRHFYHEIYCLFP